jgi:signal transduction histidine kinase
MEAFGRSDKRKLAEAIERRRDDILAQWLGEVTRDVEVSGVSLSELKDALPKYLAELARALEKNEREIALSGSEAWASVAKEHAVTRVHLGFDIAELVHEFIVLRHVLVKVAVEERVTIGTAPNIIAELVDAAIAVAVKAYVDARDQLAKRAQNETIAFLTHDLRNPLNAAILATSQLRRGEAPAQKHLFDVLDRNQRRLQQLIDGVLATQRFEAGKLESRPARMTLGELLAEPIASCAETARSKGLVFHAAFEPNIAVDVDPILTRSAVQNLLENAVKFTDLGEVTLSVDARPNELVLHVRDSGPGIPQDELRRIFDPFMRGESVKQGSGIGLAIARAAIEAQGGNLDAESPDRRGSHFWIRLPSASATR